MPTFRKVEIVDAREFSGDTANANALVLWVNSNEGKAEHHTNGIRVYETYASRKFETAFPGDWIERRQNGTFQVTRKQVIATYEEV